MKLYNISLYLQYKNNISSIGLDYRTVFSQVYVTAPPNLELNLSRSKFGGNTLVASKAGELINFDTSTYSGMCHIFTDGSFIVGSGGSSAFCIPDLFVTHSEVCSPFSSPILTELNAIKLAIQFITREAVITPNSLDKYNNQVVIFSDSLWAVRATVAMISKKYSRLINDIWDSLRAAPDIKFTITWIPSHKGHMGNETADAIAKDRVQSFNFRPKNLYQLYLESLQAPSNWKQDARLNAANSYFFEQLDVTMLHKIVRLLIVSEWNHRWSMAHNFLSETKQTIPMQWRFQAAKRYDQALLDQLRLGSLLLSQRLFKFGLHENGLCAHCQVQETLGHFILDCKGGFSASVAIRRKMNLLPSECIPFDLPFFLDDPLYSKIVIQAVKKLWQSRGQ
jgi:ribonuclease HI